LNKTSNNQEGKSVITNSKTNNTQNTYIYRRKARQKQYSKIKKLADDFNIEESQIYSLLSEYKGLLNIAKEKHDKKIIKEKGNRKSVVVGNKA
jgi:hypothetical protein